MNVTHPQPPLERGEKQLLEKTKTPWTSAYSAELCYRDPSSLKAPLDDKMKSAQNDKMKKKTPWNSVDSVVKNQTLHAASLHIRHELSTINYQLSTKSKTNSKNGTKITLE